MATTKTKRELFEASEYIEKMDLMIAKLRTKKPGELAGKVGKNDILAMRREALQQLIKDGYTINQIAEAMKDDVFSILPKTITEIVGNRNKKPQAVKKKVNVAAAPKALMPPVQAKPDDAADKSTFTPRKMDLDNL